MEERRRFSRIGCDEVVIATIAGESLIARMLDISLKGALIRFPDDLTVNIGDSCRMRLRLRDSDIFLDFRGEIVHRHGCMAGVRFGRLDIDTMIHLRSLMEARSSDPLKISEEVLSLADSF